jgi:hypothetical protein
MEYLEKVKKFCLTQKSISAAIENFLTQFIEMYEEEDQKEQKILAQCVLQMFRKYYYSVLTPDSIITPANITNTLCEREFGRDLIAVPNLIVTTNNKKIEMLGYTVTCYQADQHPMARDLEQFLKIAVAGIKMEHPGILLASEYGKLKEGLFLFDRHYINILGLMALEAGFIDCAPSGNGFIGKTAEKSGEFMGLDEKGKLRRLIEIAVLVCSRSLTQSLPELRQELTPERIAGFLRKPEEFEAAMLAMYKRMGLDLKKLTRSLRTEEDFEDFMQSTHGELENITKCYLLQSSLDIYFHTPFGYYLGLIQPFYPEIYDLAMEMDDLLADIDNFQTVRQKLFSGAAGYDLTSLGADLLTEGSKPVGKQVFAENMGDEEMHQIVLSSKEYLDNEDIDEFDDEEENDFLLELEDEVDYDFPLEHEIEEIKPAGKRKTGQVIDFQAKKDMASKNAADDQVFVFKVKFSERKSIWRLIEIKKSQALHDLHEAILDSFGLDSDHLYSFFMSNKFWDRKTEYSHPEADGKPAHKARLGRLDLNIKQKFAYVHDYGDENRFEVELVDIKEVEKGVKYPRETKRNKPTKTICDECNSDKNPIVWFCYEHGTYLCDRCVESKHDECYVNNAIL